MKSFHSVNLNNDCPKFGFFRLRSSKTVTKVIERYERYVLVKSERFWTFSLDKNPPMSRIRIPLSYIRTIIRMVEGQTVIKLVIFSKKRQK